ncbi:hypothetical protein QBC37DRAFT_477092 [Rhypophila decipiens]|uniref:Uncharacterized protein n=1 Tax=Rhypophila decipiens TaxID=261697 RepID=A0AAN6YJ50_9PEZI|nr:hypothetical protein QBC37DRAFT_477092 [Rhypophila decipiens]
MKLFFDTKNANATSSIKTANPNVITTSRRPSSVAANAPDPALLTPRDIFGRPMEPIPAPLVYINGGLGVGKEAVAESLASLLGQDKSLLVDVRAIGRDDDEDALVKGDEDSTLSLMTPEHPGYFDYFAEEEQALAVAEETEQAEDDERQGRRRLWASSWSHTFTIPASTSDTKSDNPNPSTTSASTKPSQPPQPPCSEKKLARLLSSPGNSTRIAIIAFCAFDTPMGHTALATFVTAATLANRLFIPVALSCEPTEKMRRAQSSQRQYSSKNKNRLSMSFSVSTPGPTSATSAAVASTSTSTSTALPSASPNSMSTAVGSGVSIDPDIGRKNGAGGRPSSHSFSFGGRGGASAGAHGNRNGGDSDSGRQTGQAPHPRQLFLACPIITSSHGDGGGGQRTGSNNGYSLTLDISKLSAFETALQIMELVKRLVAERDAEAQSKRERFLLDSGQVGGFDGAGDDDGEYTREDDGVGELDYDGAGEGTSDSGSDGDADPDPDVYAENFSNLTTPMEGPGYEWKV